MHIQSRKLVVRDIAHCCFATVAGAAKRPPAEATHSS